MIKRYKAINSLYLTTTIYVNGVEAVIEFKGGRNRPERVCGHFVTDNPLLQDSIEASSGYGTTFILDNSYGQEEIKVQPKKMKTKRFTKAQLKSVEAVKTEQMALEWVRIELNVDSSTLDSVAALEKCANSHGFTFSNLI